MRWTALLLVAAAASASAFGGVKQKKQYNTPAGELMGRPIRAHAARRPPALRSPLSSCRRSLGRKRGRDPRRIMPAAGEGESRQTRPSKKGCGADGSLATKPRPRRLFSTAPAPSIAGPSPLGELGVNH